MSDPIRTGTIIAMNSTSLNFDVNATIPPGALPTIRTLREKAHFSHAAVAICLLASAFLTRVAWFNDPVADYDEQLYSLIGERMLHGSLPFVDLWDRKPFGLFAIFAFSHLISGPDPIAYQIMATLFAFAGAWLIYSLAAPLVDRVTACVAGVIYLCLMTRFGSHSGQSEIFLTPFMLGMIALMRGCNAQNGDRRLIMAMLLGGIALQIKYTVLPQCIFAGIYAIYRNVKLGVPTSKVLIRSTRYALMGLLPTILVFTFYAWIGEIENYYFANFESFFLRDPVGRIDSRSPAILAPFFSLIVGGMYIRWRSNGIAGEKDHNLYFGWLIACLATVYLPGTVYIYYFAALVAPTILVGLPLLNRHGPLGAIPLALVLSGAVAMVGHFAWFREPREEAKEISALASNVAPFISTTGETGCLYVFDGPTALYQMTKSCLPTKYIYADHLNNRLERNALPVSQISEVRRILKHKPNVIITADNPVTVQNLETNAAVQAAIEMHYRHLRTVKWGPEGERNVTAWVRNRELCFAALKYVPRPKPLEIQRAKIAAH